jgi:hypothetical protein
MKARFLRFAGIKSRANRASTVGLFLALFASAAHAQGTPEQRMFAAQPSQPERCLPDPDRAGRQLKANCGFVRSKCYVRPA